MDLKPVLLALSASVAFHVSAMTALQWAGSGESEWPPEAIFVSTIPVPRENLERSSVNAVSKPLSQASSVKAVAKKPARKGLKPTAPQRHSGKSVSEAQVSSAPSNPRPKTSSELLADPKKGKIFSSYFISVKERILKALKENNADRAMGGGEVSLYFVLNGSGRLVKNSVLEGESVRDETLRRLAMDCVRDAEPFDAFPGELQTEQIAFQLRIYFDESGS